MIKTCYKTDFICSSSFFLSFFNSALRQSVWEYILKALKSNPLIAENVYGAHKFASNTTAICRLFSLKIFLCSVIR